MINTTSEQVGKLYTTHKQRLMQYATEHLPSVQDAEDVVANVFLSVCQYPHCINNVVNVEAYLIRMLKNEVSQFYRKAGKVVKLTAMPAEPIQPEYEVIASEIRHIVTEILEAMPEPCKTVGTLHFLQGIPRTKVADYVDISQRKVATCLKECRTHLIAVLHDHIEPDG